MRLIDADAMEARFVCGVGAEKFDWVYDAHDLPAMLSEMPTVDAVPVDKAISAIQEMIESIDEDFPLLDFNGRYMMERGMRMSLIQIKELRTDGERKGGDE